jgi:hypothetical protein
MELQHTDSPQITLTRQQTVNLRRNDLYTLIRAAEWLLQGRSLGRLPRVARERLENIVVVYYAECDTPCKASTRVRDKKEKSQRHLDSSSDNG